MTDLVCLSITDCNGVIIELGDLMNARDFLIAGESPQEYVAFLRECEYIQVVDGAEESTDAQGRPCRKTTLKTGKFAVNTRAFLDRFTAWYLLKRNGKEWFADNKATTAAWVKQRIQAALLPFGIPQKDMTALYQLLMVHCAAFDATSESLAVVTAADLNGKMYARPPFIVDGFLCAGLTLLAAPPKTGKSFLALDLACCIAEGKPFWGFDTVQGDVLYCDLEGTEWRTQDRFPAVGRKSKQDCPASLSVAYKAAPVDAGLIGQLDGWIASVKNPRLIILDTLAHVKGRAARGEDAYTADTRFMKPLHDLAVDKGVAILAITHTRKANGFVLDDPFDAVIGSTAQYGNSDAGWIIGGKRDDDKKQFTAVGRDFEPVSFEIERSKGGRWVFNGTMDDVLARNQRDEYQRDAVVAFIRQQLPKCGGRWTCTAQQFINEAASMTGEYLATDATRMSKKLRDLAPSLLKNDGIVVRLPDGGGKHGREFTFEQPAFTD